MGGRNVALLAKKGDGQMWEIVALRDAIARGEDGVLVTVVATEGSVPRGAGARMAVLASGAVGTVGGGAIEHACEAAARRMLGAAVGRVQAYDLSDGGETGMICGGRVIVCYMPVAGHDAQVLSALDAWLAAVAENSEAWVETSEEGVRVNTQMQAPPPLMPVWREGTPSAYIEPVGGEGTVYIFGGGHVAGALLPLLRTLSFRAEIFEDRAEYVADGILGDFEHVDRSISLREKDYAVIMTRGHEKDLSVLVQVLRTQAGYVGMMGSRKKIAATQDALRAQGFSPEVFARVHSPIGLAISAQTPEEIAVSVAAELIAHRAQHQG